MLTKVWTALTILLAVSLEVHAHAAVAPVLGLGSTAPVRKNVKRPTAQAPCGAGVNVASAIGKSTPVQAAADGTFTTTVTNFNRGRDGSRQVTAQVDATATGNGKSFVAMTVSQNGDAAPKSTGSQQIVASLPASTKCTGGASGDLCLVAFKTLGGFGNCVAVQQGGNANSTASNSTATGTAGTADASGTATGTNSTDASGTTGTDSTDASGTTGTNSTDASGTATGTNSTDTSGTGASTGATGAGTTTKQIGQGKGKGATGAAGAANGKGKGAGNGNGKGAAGAAGSAKANGAGGGAGNGNGKGAAGVAGNANANGATTGTTQKATGNGAQAGATGNGKATGAGAGTGNLAKGRFAQGGSRAARALLAEIEGRGEEIANNVRRGISWIWA